MREIIAIIVIYIAQRMTDLESGGFAFALPVVIGFIALVYLCLALGERFFAGDTLSWFRIDRSARRCRMMNTKSYKTNHPKRKTKKNSPGCCRFFILTEHPEKILL